MALRLPALSPVAWVTVERLTQQVLWLILFAVLAPILGPRPYGLFSIAMVFIGFCEFVLLEGAAEALVTVETLDQPHTTTANLTNGGIALGFGVAMAALAPAITLLFHDTEIKYLVWALTPLPVLSALSATPIAVMRRSMQYRRLAVRSIVGLMIGGIFGIILGVTGAGVWALVLQVLAQRLAEVTIAWMSVPNRLGFGWSAAHFREMRPVAMNVFTARMMIFAGGQVPRVILGYQLGPTDLGLFTLANRFLDIIVFITILPRAAVGRIELRNSLPGSAEFERTFVGMTQHASVLSFPLFLGAAAVVPDLFQVWLGQRWLAGTVPTQLLLLSGVPFVFFYCIDAALLATNLSSVYRRLSTVQALSIIATVGLTAQFGLNVACLSLAVRPWLLLPLFLWLIRRSCYLPIYDFLRLPLRSLVGAIAMAVLLTLPWLRPLWFYDKFNLVFLVSIGMTFYFLFLYSFSRAQLRSLLTGIFLRRS